MIKNTDNLTILNVKIDTTDVANVKDGDIVFFDNINNVWKLCKGTETEIQTVFGVVIDDNDGNENRLVALDGMVEVNVEEAGHPQMSFLFFKNTQNSMTFSRGTTTKYIAGYLVKNLSQKYGYARALVRITNNNSFNV
ncbi:MAG: hypothetical protein GYA14_13850 [Ignavibacteria bacterium]|nr:hypothetical protein [Ignavibacteria bacterium]